MIVGLILAGGEGRRMGRTPKPEVRLGNMPLIEHVRLRLTPQTDDIFISGQKNYGTNLRNISDLSHERIGPVGGIQASFQWLLNAYPDIEGVLITPCDVPFLPHDLLEKLKGLHVSAAHDGKRLQPTLSWWPRAHMAQAVKHIEEGKARSLHGLLELCDARVVAFPSSQAFFNINTPEDLKTAADKLSL